MTDIQEKTILAKKALQTVKGFIGRNQLRAMVDICRGEEREFMLDKIIEYGSRIDTMPRTYEQDGKGDDAIAYLHYFKGGMDWYITEKDKEAEQLQAFGLSDFGYGEPELGYINIEELTKHGVELDLYFIPKTIGRIKEFLKSAGKLAVATTLAASLAMTLSACSSTVWVKPNSTPAEWEQVQADCGIEAANRVPPHMVQSVEEGRSYSTEKCDKRGRNCSTYTTSHDTNAPLRNQAFRACLSRNGWSEQVKP